CNSQRDEIGSSVVSFPAVATPHANGRRRARSLGSGPDPRPPCALAELRRTAKRNGGRHCCQPPLRRAKDLPVFVTWSASARRLGLTRSRSWLTSSGVAFHPTAPSEEEP